MDRTAGTSLLEHFAALEDPRQTAKVLYPLPEILLLLLAGTLAGADDFSEMELWGNWPSCADSCPTSTGSPVTTRWARWWQRSIPRCSRPAL